MRKVFQVTAFLIVVIGLIIWGLNNFAAEVEDENGVAWFSGTILGTV